MAARTLTVAAAALALLLLPQAALAKRGDRNHDRIPDRWERHFPLSLTKNQARRDPDHDGLNNKREFGAHTTPRKADTDGDRLDDGDEVASANDPRDPDTDGDGTEDGDENGGWGRALDGGTLTPRPL